MRETIMRCKVAFNFQTVEFDFLVDLDNDETLNDMFTLYDKVMTGLQAVSPEQQNAKLLPKEPLASEKQVNCLEALGVPREEAKKMTVKKASAKIKELTS